jgi:Holliday junction resolvase RusA-like endonuclease
MIRIVIPGEPISKMRPKFSSRGKFTKVYDPQEKLKQEMKKSLSLFVKLNESDELEDYFSLPLSVSLSYHMSIPVSDSNASKNAKLWHFINPSVKPDIDNLIKWSLDLSNLILWKDDAQIVNLSASQIYSKNPCTIIEIKTIKEIKMADEYAKVFHTFSPDDFRDFVADMWRFYNDHSLDLCDDRKMSELEMAAAARHTLAFSEKWVDKLKKVRPKK